MTTILTLEDLCQPFGEHPLVPNWDWVRICADNFEERGEEDTARALRWLADYDHWPTLSIAQEGWIWYVDGHRESYTNSRYNGRDYREGAEADRERRATLPPFFLAVTAVKSIGR